MIIRIKLILKSLQIAYYHYKVCVSMMDSPKIFINNEEVDKDLKPKGFLNDNKEKRTT